MTIKVVNKENPKIFTIYKNVDEIRTAFNDNGLICGRLVIGEEAATFPIMEWDFYKLGYTKMSIL